MSDISEMSTDELRAERDAAQELKDEAEVVGDVIGFLNQKRYLAAIDAELESRE